VEKALAAHDELWAAAGHPHTVFRLSYRELLGITGGREAELAA
jgi:prolyl-tRNA editing enzyme YbaK/EbsC (Cys-tRNA(Pro) deacylase)